MTEKSTLVLAFVLGTIFGCVSLIRSNGKRVGWKDYAVILGMMAGLYILSVFKLATKQGSTGHEYEISGLFAALTFSFLYGLFFKKEVLPRISNFTAYYFTLVLWYYLLFTDINELPGRAILYWVAALPTLVTVIFAWWDLSLNKAGKIYNYIWYMILMLTLGLLNMRSEYADQLFNGGREKETHVLGMFFMGMSMNFAVLMFTNLYNMIPIPGKRQTLKSRMKEWHEDLEILESKSVAWQVPLSRELAVTAAFAALAFGNRHFGWVSSGLFGTFAIVMMPIAFSFAHFGPRNRV